MDEIILTSTLSIEEIEKNFVNIDFFTALMSGLEDALYYEKCAVK